jgi:hypothetical protein
MDLLWPDADFELKSAANNFHQVLHAARRALEAAGGNSSGYLYLQGDVISRVKLRWFFAPGGAGPSSVTPRSP